MQVADVQFLKKHFMEMVLAISINSFQNSVRLMFGVNDKGFQFEVKKGPQRIVGLEML